MWNAGVWLWIESRIEKRNKKSAEIKDSKRISRSTGKVRERGRDVNECDMTHLTILTIVEWNISANFSQASSPWALSLTTRPPGLWRTQGPPLSQFPHHTPCKHTPHMNTDIVCMTVHKKPMNSSQNCMTLGLFYLKSKSIVPWHIKLWPLRFWRVFSSLALLSGWH